jgi:hypothetical protein
VWRKFAKIVSRKNRAWVLGAIGLILISAALKTKLGTSRPEPDTTAYHYSQWLHQTENLGYTGNFTNRISFKKIIWYLDGRPSFHGRVEKLEKHQNALIRLGYFQERAFDFKGIDPAKFMNAVSDRARQAGLVIVFSHSQDTTAHIIVRNEDMAAIEAIVKDIEADHYHRQ